MHIATLLSRPKSINWSDTFILYCAVAIVCRTLGFWLPRTSAQKLDCHDGYYGWVGCVGYITVTKINHFGQKRFLNADFYGYKPLSTSLASYMWVQHKRYGGSNLGENGFQFYSFFIYQTWLLNQNQFLKSFEYQWFHNQILYYVFYLKLYKLSILFFLTK